MKKLFAPMLTLVMLFTMAACGGTAEETKQTGRKPERGGNAGCRYSLRQKARKAGLLRTYLTIHRLRKPWDITV